MEQAGAAVGKIFPSVTGQSRRAERSGYAAEAQISKQSAAYTLRSAVTDRLLPSFLNAKAGRGTAGTAGTAATDSALRSFLFRALNARALEHHVTAPGHRIWVT